ncbi:MAG: metallophosphoesterase family protein [Lachnospiraceae bacterium]|nr:metallophosphoesterase family protein [Lachnospiraceae bacterium]
MTHKIGILSDTHSLLRDEVKSVLTGCEVILHAGDLSDMRILETLRLIAPTHAVAGNTDKTLSGILPQTLSLELFGIRIFMIHNKKMCGEALESYDLIVYGHSHKYEEKRIGGQTFLNPGSCGPRRFSLPVTMAVLTAEENGSFHIERIDLSAGAVTDFSSMDKRDMQRLISSVIKDLEKGRSVDEICSGNKLSRSLTEQLCRLYLTHPGIDADGVLNKLL